MPDHEYIVVGGGPMGAATARYLAEADRRVVLLAPRDPAVSTSGVALPSSHADHSRVTRRLDTDATWARLASASVARYRQLEQRSGIGFFTATGCLTVIEGTGERAEQRLAATAAIAEAFAVPHERVSGRDLRARFPYLRVSPGTTALSERHDAGWLDPRAYVQAQIAVGRARGLTVMDDVMTRADVDGVAAEVVTAAGRTLAGGEAVFAMGPYSAYDLPAAPPPLTVYARTVVHVPLDEHQRRALEGMPSLIVRGLTDEQNCYILPPVRYPDGEWHVKIGGGARAQRIESRDELDDWFAGPGDAVLGCALRARIDALLPVTQGSAHWTQSCAITVTESGLPLVSRLGRRATLVTGGNGHAAKSGDEIGRTAAEHILGRDVTRH